MLLPLYPATLKGIVLYNLSRDDASASGSKVDMKSLPLHGTLKGIGCSIPGALLFLSKTARSGQGCVRYFSG